MKRSLFMLVIFGILSGGLVMAQSADKVFPYKYSVKTLDNGLNVIMIPMSGANGLVSYYSIVRTGSRDEYEPGHSGFAHFFEHMMFRGTKKYPGNVYDKLITGMGANANAYTTDDYTAYHLTFSEKNLEKIMELEADRFMNLFYEEAEFQTEAGAVYGEYRKNVTNPWMVLIERLQDMAYDKHTYKHTTMGFEEDIKAMPTMYAYSQSFFKRYYRPENVILVIAGDITEDNTMTLVNKYYADWESGYVAPRIPVEPKQTSPRRDKVSYAGKSLPLLTVAYKGAAFDVKNKKLLAASLLGDLAFGQNSAIYKKLTLKEQKVQFIDADFGFNRDPNLFVIYSMVKSQDDVKYVEDEILGAIEQFRSVPVADEKLKAAKMHRKYSFLMNLDTPGKVAGNLARYVALTGGIDVIDEMFTALDTISPADIQAAANEYLVPESRSIISLQGAK